MDNVKIYNVQIAFYKGMSTLKRISLKTLARELGLSVTTVSRALKDGPEVKPETIARVKQAATDMGYVPNLGGLKLKTGKSYAICAALSTWNASEIGDAGSVALIQGIQTALNATDYNLIIVNMVPGEKALPTLTNIVAQQLADGIILDQIQPHDARVKFLLENQFPFVTYGRTQWPTPHPYFDIDEQRATFEATNLLIAKGHQRIALFNANKDYMFVQNRLRGYTQALANASIAVREDLLSFSSLNAGIVRRLAQQMCQRKQPPTAFLSQSEAVTLAICAGIRDAGAEVGRDIEIISRDGTALCDYLAPPISSQYHSLHKSGEKLTDFLLRSINGEAAEHLQELAVATLIDKTATEQSHRHHPTGFHNR